MEPNRNTQVILLRTSGEETFRRLYIGNWDLLPIRIMDDEKAEIQAAMDQDKVYHLHTTIGLILIVPLELGDILSS